ncbi:polyprenyl synthetase [Paenibacillus oryzae]|uniref:Farnesyl diphosphate synthase n=1 Tax=Paenibacillus oryzae TaxID=1844972 RepID=A0A1A5YBQ9_9BACL|nr:polyprenyl synthetase [Paenibacillus oryzae]
MSASPTITDYLKQCAAETDKALLESLPQHWEVPGTLRESMAYSLSAGGKKIRPALVLTAAEAVAGSLEARRQALPIACAVEHIHTYSLIHDDLPAMDNDDYRRGRLTNHKVFGEAMAILAGDALLTHAFYLISRGGREAGLEPSTMLAIVEDLSMLAGAPGMVGGQVADMQGEQGITGLSQLEYIHLHKTGDLIAFSAMAGGRVGGATERQLELLGRYGRTLGLAFQIQDDILDLVGDEAKLGKPVNSDIEGQKVTYPFLIGLEESKRLASKLTEEAKGCIQEAGFTRPERLLQLADYLIKRDH